MHTMPPKDRTMPRPPAEILLLVALGCTDKAGTTFSLTSYRICSSGVFINGRCVEGSNLGGLVGIGTKDPGDTEFMPNPWIKLGLREEPLIPAVEYPDNGALIHPQGLQDLEPGETVDIADIGMKGLIVGTAPGALFGASSASAALDGGTQSLVVGEPGVGGAVLLHDVVVEGEIDAFFGTQILHDEVSSGFGLRMVAAAQDQRDVLAISAPFGSAVERRGEVWLLGQDLVVGRPISDAAQGRLSGRDPNDLAGAALAAVDADGDGEQELVVGAPGAGLGVVYLLPADVSGDVLLGDIGNTISSPDHSSFGAQVVPSADVNGDGHPELIIGAPGEAGGVYIADAAGLLEGSFSIDLQAARVVGSEDSGGLGAALHWSAVHGLFIGAPNEAEGAGRLYQVKNEVLAGAIEAASLMDTSELDSMVGATGEGLGVSVQADLDMDGDDFPDLAVGARAPELRGRMSLFLSSTFD
jgi:FG-GAP repeat